MDLMNLFHLASPAWHLRGVFCPPAQVKDKKGKREASYIYQKVELKTGSHSLAKVEIMSTSD